MANVVDYLWLIPVLPLAAAAVTAVLPRGARGAAVALAVGAMALSFLLAAAAFARTVAGDGLVREVANFDWVSFGGGVVRLGWVLDPLSASMAVMVTFVGALIFVYSAGYMAEDPNFKQFFCFLSLFAAAMLGVVLANSLLLLFICWELVGLASYLLIGFWFHKPEAAAAARKAFVTTRIGDLGLFAGMLWLYRETGTLVFYEDGLGCLEGAALARLGAETLAMGLGLSTVISLLVFCGAIGKSGQVPLHVWLPDAMEGPTPVSALIHAATMVAAGVFLMARVYPLLALVPAGYVGSAGVTPALQVVAWVGAVTAVFAALIAVAQNDIKRILAYSTVSQLGYMFLGLGTGGVAVAMFHLLTHAFFKALLFLGAGSVIHGCHHEQDIRKMGGLRRHMPVTFAVYAVGMMALCGVPLFAGFWSKDGILHAAHAWPVSAWPFLLGAGGALLTAFYMTRQVCRVFFGAEAQTAAGTHGAEHRALARGGHAVPHESPAVMTVPLVVLAVCSFGVGFVGTPFWPWLAHYFGDAHEAVGPGVWALMGVSTLVVAAGMTVGWRLYGRAPAGRDPLGERFPAVWRWLEGRFFVDELYAATVGSAQQGLAVMADWIDRRLVGGIVAGAGWLALALAWMSRAVDDFGVNLGFDTVCRSLQRWGRRVGALQDGQVQHSLRGLALGVVVMLLLLTWGCGR